jgi:hypothetical protein
MATLRITQALLGDVKDMLNRMRTDAMNREANPLEPMMDADRKHRLSSAAVAFIWGEHAHLRSVVPKEWMKEAKELRISVGEVNYYTCIERKVLVPPNSSLGYAYSMDIELPANLVPPDIFAEMVTYKTKTEEVNAKYLKVDAQVLGLLRDSPSLNTAVKEYPNLRLYIPKSYLTRIDAPMIPRNKQKPTDEEALLPAPVIDDALLASVGVAHAISSTGG